MHGKEIVEADNEHDRGILDVDDKVVADLRHDVAQSLRQHHAQHGLHMRHADGLRALGLPAIHREDTAAHGLSHVRAGIDGYHQDGHRPDIAELHGVVGEIAIIDEHRLQNHGRAAEYLNIGADNAPQQPQQPALDKGIAVRAGNGLQYAAQKADHAANQRGNYSQQQGAADAV